MIWAMRTRTATKPQGLPIRLVVSNPKPERTEFIPAEWILTRRDGSKRTYVFTSLPISKRKKLAA